MPVLMKSFQILWVRCELTFTEPAWARYAIIKLSKAMGIFIPEEYDSTFRSFFYPR